MIKMEKDGLYLSALDNAKTVVQQLCSNFFLKSQACICIPELFPLKRKTCIHLHLLNDFFNVHSIYFDKILMCLYL